jgi:manganese transport protein
VLPRQARTALRERSIRVKSSGTPWAMIGPAFVAAVAYVDPGNFATNFSAGGSFGYRLLWVILASNAVAVLIQFLSAKLGIATGRDLATLCREEFTRPLRLMLWFQAEAVAIATDVAEVVGGAVALRFLFGMPLVAGGIVTALISMALVQTQSAGTPRFERAVAVILLLCLGAFGYLLQRSGVAPSGLARGLSPGFDGRESMLLATAILGATVMPHVVYVHSALTSDRYSGMVRIRRQDLLRALRIDLGLAMGTAGLMNVAMLVIAAQLARRSPPSGGDALVGVHEQIHNLWGPMAATAFAVALLLSGIASTAVGAYAGQVVIAGFFSRVPPLLIRRAVALVPALILLGFAGPTSILLWSQVALSIGIPFTLVPLLIFTGQRRVMGSWVNRPITTVVGALVSVSIIAVNGYLLAAL